MATRMRFNEQGLLVAEDSGDPQGGEPPTTFVPEDVVADVLMYAAVDVESIGCKDEWCEECNPMRTAWWKAMNSLSDKTRRATQALMCDAGVALVPGPFEEEKEGALPTPLHG